MADVSKYDDVIDSRDVIARIEELEDERNGLAEALEEHEQNVADYDPEEDEGAAEAELQQELYNAREALRKWDSGPEAEELATLKALAEEAEQCAPDWRYGETLIRDSYFTEYAQDIGDLPRDIPHYIEIDWEATARNIQEDYTAVDFDGVTYWIR